MLSSSELMSDSSEISDSKASSSWSVEEPIIVSLESTLSFYR